MCGKYYIHKQSSSIHTVQSHGKISGLIFKLYLHNKLEFYNQQVLEFLREWVISKELASRFHLTFEIHMSMYAPRNKTALQICYIRIFVIWIFTVFS